MERSSLFTALTDRQLLDEIGRLASSERSATAALVAALAELDSRRLYLPLGFSCLFTYCTRALHLSEDAAFNRIEVARASRRFPQLLQLLDEGALSLTSIRLLAPHLTPANVEDTVRAAQHLNRDGVKLVIAKLNPQPPVPSIIRKLPALKGPIAPTDPPAAAALIAFEAAPATQPQPAPIPPPPSRRPLIAPLSEAHYKLQVTISTSAHERLRHIQDLMRHTIPNGDPAAIVERALEVLHADLLKKKAAMVARPRASNDGEAAAAKERVVPAPVKRQVWLRDKGCCAFTAGDGTRCGERGCLEYHHVDPYAHGGEATVANIELRCRAHNGFEWELHVEETNGAGASWP